MIAGVALVTGANGQDGSYLVERLVADGYAVHAAIRPGDASRPTVTGVHIHRVDLADHEGLRRIVDALEPTHVFHLGGLSSVAASWTDPVGTAEVTGVLSVVLLDAALRLQERLGRPVRFVQSASSEIFGTPRRAPQDEHTPVRPVSPYGAAKALAHACAEVYRGRGLAVSSLILYNHESPRRPTTFVTRKITQGAARIARSGGGELTLGNLEARRDWGWAPDYVDAMVRAAAGEPDNFVIATGVAHSVQEFVATAFAHVRIEDWERHVTVDPGLFRPAEPTLLVGDAGRARTQLGWAPTRSFEEIVAAMVDHDLSLLG